MNWPLFIAGLALLVLLLAWGIHYTAWQCGRLAGLAEAERRHWTPRGAQSPSSASELDAVKLDAAMAAVRHVLGVICDNPAVGYQLGHYTQSYALLCQAVATHRGESPEAVRERYRPAQYPVEPDEPDQPDPTLTPLQRFVAQELNISPVIAKEIVAFARRKNIPVDERRGSLAAFTRWADAKAKQYSRAHYPPQP